MTPDAEHVDSDRVGRDRERVRATIRLLVVLNVVAAVAGVSRMWPPTVLLQGCGDVLRWREALSMLVFAPLLVLVLWRLCLTASDGHVDAWTTTFVAGAYFLGAGMGMHDTCDLLARVYRGAEPRDLLSSLRFFDDLLGHWVFFGGFVLASVSAGVQQLRFPLTQPMSRRTVIGLVLLSTPLMLVMVSNLMFERTGVDLTVIAAALLLVGGAHVRLGGAMRRLPMLCVLYPAYAVAVAGTLLYWVLC